MNNITKVNWLDFSILLKHTSVSLRNNDLLNIEKHLINSIYTVLQLAKENDINMNVGWKRWITKVNHKNYVSDK